MAIHLQAKASFHVAFALDKQAQKGQHDVQAKASFLGATILVAPKAWMELSCHGCKWVVEVQRTRGGKNKDGTDTRPYPFGAFDILVVSLQPATGNWDSFLYTVGTWLIPRNEQPHLIRVMQPVSVVPDSEWTDDPNTCINWFLSGTKKRLSE